MTGLFSAAVKAIGGRLITVQAGASTATRIRVARQAVAVGGVDGLRIALPLAS